MTYRTHLQEAHLRTLAFGLASPGVPSLAPRILTPETLERLPYVVRDAIGEPDLHQIAAQCLAIHSMLREPLEQFFGSPVTYTIGYVHSPPNDLFRESEENLRELMRTGISSPSLNIHSWLTLASDEILDFVLPTTQAIVARDERGLGSVVSAHADELQRGLRYHPLLLGENYLERIGAKVNVAAYVL
jgi:hypothetical protein